MHLKLVTLYQLPAFGGVKNIANKLQNSEEHTCVGLFFLTPYMVIIWGVKGLQPQEKRSPREALKAIFKSRKPKETLM